MKINLNSPTVSLEKRETFRIRRDTLEIGTWKEERKGRWFSTELTIENVDFRELLDILAEHLEIKILEDEETESSKEEIND